ncbi:MAG: tyrosine-type recombinase/integrase [bacterium]|nr:tyrosine-type recombinase/integrase [bacterium]
MNGSDSSHIESVRKRFARALRATGVNFRFRDLRAFHAIYLRKQGVDPYLIQRSLGHEKLDVTLKHYMDLADGEMENAVKKLKKVY